MARNRRNAKRFTHVAVVVPRRLPARRRSKPASLFPRCLSPGKEAKDNAGGTRRRDTRERPPRVLLRNNRTSMYVFCVCILLGASCYARPVSWMKKRFLV